MLRRRVTPPISAFVRPLSSSSSKRNIPSDSSKSPEPKPSPADVWKARLDDTREQLRIWGQLNASLLRQRATHLSSHASASLQEAGGKLNQVTGYHEIEALKKKVVDVEHRMTNLREAAKNAKVSYEQAVTNRSSGQREVNDLLQRKSSWSDNDVIRFTSLVRQDHLNEQLETSSKIQLAESEAAVEKEFNELMRAILNRYHEEQVWSDKIRSASTYGSLLALGLNVVVFILAIVLVEPYKRKRLAQTFEKRIEEISRENQAMIQSGMSELTEHFSKQENVLSQIAGVALAPPPPPQDPPIPVDHQPPVAPVESVIPQSLSEYLPYLTQYSKKETIALGIGGVVGGGLVGLVLSLIKS